MNASTLIRPSSLPSFSDICTTVVNQSMNEKVVSPIILNGSVAATSARINYTDSNTLPTNSSDINVTLNILAATVCVITLFIGIVGNVLVLIVFGSRWSRLRSFEIYMVSLAAADFIVTITYPSLMLHELVGGSFCSIGVAGCIGLLFMTTTGVAVSSLTLVFISLDRYFVVKWPLRERHNKYKILAIIFVTWIVGFCLGSLYFVEDRVLLRFSDGNVPVCRLHFETHYEFKEFVAILFVTQSGIPLLLVTILYILIIYELHKSSYLSILRNREHLRQKRHERNRKATRLLIAILLVFFISITPEKVFYLIYTFDQGFIQPHLFQPIYTILAMFFMTNSCLNPIIYAKLHTSFRRSTLRMFCSCVCTRYKSYTWTSLGASFQTLVSYSIRRASSHFSRTSESSFLFDIRRQRSRSATGSIYKERSPQSENMHRTLSGPACAFAQEPGEDFNEEIRIFDKASPDGEISSSKLHIPTEDHMFQLGSNISEQLMFEQMRTQTISSI